MKLDLVVWRAALLRLEAELKRLKHESHRARAPGERVDTAALFLCKAEVTRLYCLRRAARGLLHTTGRLRWIRLGYSTQLPYTELREPGAGGEGLARPRRKLRSLAVLVDHRDRSVRAQSKTDLRSDLARPSTTLGENGVSREFRSALDAAPSSAPSPGRA